MGHARMRSFPWLTALTLIPLLGALAIGSAAAAGLRAARALATLAAGAALAATLWIAHLFRPGLGGLQFEELHAWIPALAVSYHLGIDGIGLVMLLLAAMVVLFSIAACWSTGENSSLYFALVLLLEAGLFGTFTALNFIHWFLYWELSLMPAFFLVRLWGGPGRARAATQFFIYTMVGSVALLLAFLALFAATRQFDFIQLASLSRRGGLVAAIADNLHWAGWSGDGLTMLIFCGAFLGFAVKVPIMPFHSWLPAAYSEAPPSVTMLLTGAMSKMGLYGLLRILLPIFPGQMRQALTPLLWLATASIVLSTFAAWAQSDLRRIFAYSSINHLGYCALAIFAALKFSPASSAPQYAALDGAVLQIFNHALTASVLFWFVALLETRSGGLGGLSDFGGVRKVAPVLCGLMGAALFSSLGLPGLNGFVGEFLIFKGVFALFPAFAALSVLGLLMTAVVLLTVLERVFLGPLSERRLRMPDLSIGERSMLAAPLALMLALGLDPQLILGLVNRAVMQLASQLR